MSKRRQRFLRVRVDHEPNRFSQDCLEKVYEQLDPTTRREAGSANKRAHDKVHRQKTKRASNEQG